MTDARKALADLSAFSIEDFLCEGNCKNPGMCDGTEATWCGRKAEAISSLVEGFLAVALALRPLPGTREEVAREALADIIAEHIAKNAGWDELSIADEVLAALPPAPMPEREGMREGIIEECAKRAENYFENYELANPVARGNVKAIGKKIADDIRAALAPHDKTSVLKFKITSYPSELMGEGPASDLRLLADFFSESAHETWSKEEIVNIIEDAIRLGAPAPLAPHDKTEG